MRVKSMLIFIVLNIFLMLFSSVLFEYIDLEDRLNNITTVINESGDAAVAVSTASEELFTAKYLDHLTSYGIANEKCPEHQRSYTKTATNILLFDDDGNGHQVNTYALAVYYCKKDRMPHTSTDFNEIDTQIDTSDFTVEKVYEFLYGESGTDYKAGQWYSYTSSLNSVYNSVHSSTLRQMNDSDNNAAYNDLSTKGKKLNDFQTYVKKVYDSIYTTNIIKHNETSTNTNTNYSISQYSYPVLLNMGLNLRSTTISNMNVWKIEDNGTASKSTTLTNWDSLLDSNMYTNDFFLGSFHWGKTRQFGAGQTTSNSAYNKWSKYFLTPNTLGVTYVPLSVVKPSFIGLLKTKVQLNKASSGNATENNANFSQVIRDSLGCLDTTVYDTAHGVASNVSQQHQVQSNENIVNDGDIEYDLNTIQVKVEYFDCDFYTNTNEIDNVINRIEGAVPNWTTNDGTNHGKLLGAITHSQSACLSQVRLKLKGTDTNKFKNSNTKLHAIYDKNGNDGDGKRLVAKVTYRMKVHIPYHSSIMQLMCFRDGHTAHYDIRQFIPGLNRNLHTNTSLQGGGYHNGNIHYDTDVTTDDIINGTGRADLTQSGVWYQYSTYYSVTR